MRVGKRKTLQTKITVNDQYDATLCLKKRPVSLDIWRVERSFWPSWFSIIQAHQFIHSGHFLFSTRVLWSAALVPMVGASCFPNLFRKVSSSFLLQFIFQNFVSVLREPYFLNWHKFLVIAFSSLLHGVLHYQYIVTALKIIIYNNIICLCLQTSTMYLKLNVI